MLSLLKSLQEQGVITQGDYYFAQLIADKQKDARLWRTIHAT